MIYNLYIKVMLIILCFYIGIKYLYKLSFMLGYEDSFLCWVKWCLFLDYLVLWRLRVSRHESLRRGEYRPLLICSGTHLLLGLSASLFITAFYFILLFLLNYFYNFCSLIHHFSGIVFCHFQIPFNPSAFLRSFS